MVVAYMLWLLLLYFIYGSSSKIPSLWLYSTRVELVKWSANKEAKSVLLNFDESMFAPAMLEIDMYSDDVNLPNAKVFGAC